MIMTSRKISFRLLTQTQIFLANLVKSHLPLPQNLSNLRKQNMDIIKIPAVDQVFQTIQLALSSEKRSTLQSNYEVLKVGTSLIRKLKNQ